MNVYYSFRMSGSQRLLISKWLKVAEKTPIIVGLCGIGNCKCDDATHQSFSLTDKIYRDFLETFRNTSEISMSAVNAITIFHDWDNGYVTWLEKDRILISDHNSSLPKAGRYISCYLCDDGRCIAYILHEGNWQQFDSTCVSGEEILFSFRDDQSIPEHALRTSQAFGASTTKLISKLTVGVVGISGTGSLVSEQLYRLGVKKLVLVDDDYIEIKNLNRIVNSTVDDAKNVINKAIMMAEFIKKSGLTSNVIALPTVIANSNTVRQLSQCDVLFGCMDSIDGRHQLNKLATYYSIPYIDVGIKLTSDGMGGIREIGGVINYLQPDGVNLMDRGLYSVEQLTAADLKRSNPSEYKRRLDEKYILGVSEDSPAVISVNMTVAGMAINEMLARLHPYRCLPNKDIDAVYIDLSEPRFKVDTFQKNRNQPRKNIGRGDQCPLLDMPILSEG